MKPLALVAAAAAAVVALTACSQTASTSPASTSPASTTLPVPLRSTATNHSVSPADCRQQYNAWRNGHAGTIVADVNSVDAAVTAKDLSALTAAMKKARPAAVEAARYPMPGCADPQGYWMTLMMHVNAAAASAGSTSGGASTMLSVLKNVPTVKSKLSAELKRTTGVKQL